MSIRKMRAGATHAPGRGGRTACGKVVTPNIMVSSYPEHLVNITCGTCARVMISVISSGNVVHGRAVQRVACEGQAKHVDTE